MASRDISDCSAPLQTAWGRAVAVWESQGHEATPFLTCTYRSNEEQDDLYAQGRTKPGRIVTKAKAGESPHNLIPAEAFDIAFKNKDGSLNWSATLFDQFAKIMQTVNDTIIWGGNWKFRDNPHFETFDWKQPHV